MRERKRRALRRKTLARTEVDGSQPPHRRQARVHPRGKDVPTGRGFGVLKARSLKENGWLAG